MRIKCLLTVVLTTAFFTVIAQGRREDVVYLKNESVIRGTIVNRDNDQLKIQTAEGNIWVYKTSDIIKTTRENRFGSYHNIGKGYAQYTELGPLVAGKTTIDGVTTAAFSFQTVNGYSFKRFFFAGAGIGVDLYATQTMLPLFGSIRGDLSGSGSVMPFYFADAGYAINITQNSTSSTDFKGGLLYAAGLGLKIPFNRSAGFLISFGYRHQVSSYRLDAVIKEVEYNRLAIRAGFFF